MGARQGSAMANLIRQLDNTRPITAAMNNGIGHGLTGVIDVQGFNYHPETYDPVHREFPKKPLIATEIAAAVGTRGVYAREPFTVPKDTTRYEGTPALCQVAAYDVNAPDWAETAEEAWQAVAERPWMAGGFVWSGFDYRGEPTPFCWTAINSSYAILDTCGFPKDVYYYYKSWWTDQPVLHLFPHWNWPGRAEQDIDVWCYSNCKAGRIVPQRAQPRQTRRCAQYSHLEWKVKYACREHWSPKGYDERGKDVICPNQGGNHRRTRGHRTRTRPHDLDCRRHRHFTAHRKDSGCPGSYRSRGVQPGDFQGDRRGPIDRRRQWRPEPATNRTRANSAAPSMACALPLSSQPGHRVRLQFRQTHQVSNPPPPLTQI